MKLDGKRFLKWLMVVLLPLRADCSLLALKPAPSSRLLPAGAPNHVLAPEGVVANKIEFQYKAPGSSRPEDVVQDEEIKFDGLAVIKRLLRAIQYIAQLATAYTLSPWPKYDS
jgi:hypothetical protein